MPQLLLEDVCGPFLVDRTKGARGIITETDISTTRWRIPGRFSVCNIKNGNNRRYSFKVWENNLKPGSQLCKMMAASEAFGLLEHPEDGKVDLRSPISHTVVKAELQPNGEVLGEILIIDCGDNSPGRKLKTLIENGYNPYVSSRGFGSLVPAPDGVDEVQEDFICEGWDVVHKPSFTMAVLTPRRETLGETKPSSTKPAQPTGVAQVSVTTATLPVTTTNGTPITQVQVTEAQPVPAKPATPKQKQTTMEHKEIKLQLDSIAAQLGAGQITGTRITETAGRLDQLHRAVESYLHEDNTNSWDGQKLHKEISLLEDKLAAIQEAPTQEVKRLREQNVKLLKVMRLITEKAVTYRKSLSASAVRTDKVRTISESLLAKGRDYRTRCLKLQEDLIDIDFQADVLSETLDMVVADYNQDVVKLSRQLITHKLGEAKLTVEIKQRLGEATCPSELMALHEELFPAEDGSPAAKPNEAPAPPAPALAASRVVVPMAEGVELSYANRNPQSLVESVDIVKRLSASVATAE